PHQVDGALEGGARVCGDEAEVRICEGALSRTEEECHPTVRGVRSGKPVSAAEKTVASGIGLRRSEGSRSQANRRSGGKSENGSETFAPADLLPRRHGLFRVSLVYCTHCLPPMFGAIY